MRQYFDDGSYVDFDAAGNSIGGVDAEGRAFAADTSIVNTFLSDVSGLLVAKIREGFGVRPAAATPAPAAARAQTGPNLLLIAAVIVAAVLIARS